MRSQPIIVTFYFHWDNPIRRELTVRSLRTVTDIFATHRVRAHYGFVGVVLQQLAEDSPETVEEIRRLRMAIGYHGGAGDQWGGPVGYPRDTRGLSWEEAVRAFWEFETHTLDRDTQEPVRGEMGGWLAIQDVLGVTPLPTDARGKGRMDTPQEYVLSRMGAASYPFVCPYGPGAVILSPLHEPQLFPGDHGVPPTYFGKGLGVDAPMTADPLRWFDLLARNLPDDTTFVVQCMSHAGGDWDRLGRLIRFLADRQDDFRIAQVDPEGAQWRLENSPLAFYQRIYGITSLPALMALSEPPTPSPKTLTREGILLAADAVLSAPSLNSHDGDFGEPPDYVDIGIERLSLADTFQAFARAFSHYAQAGALPEQASLPHLRGPIDYPRYDRPVRPRPSSAPIPGYTPTEVRREEAPDAAIVNAQGLPPSGDYHIWMPTHAIADGQAIIEAATRLDLSDHIPGVARVRLPSEASRGGSPQEVEVALNPAEFLYAMAQVVRSIAREGAPGPALLVSTKVSSRQLTRCVLVRPGGHRDSFLWRSDLSPAELDAMWTRIPAPKEDEILWGSLPPLGGRAKARPGRRPGERAW